MKNVNIFRYYCSVCGNTQDKNFIICNKCRKSDTSDETLLSLRKISDQEIISNYNKLKNTGKIDSNEPNYTLAEKVFREFNNLDLKIIDCGYFGHDLAPRSVLPYPRNYITCAYHVFLEYAKKQNDLKMFKIIQEVGVHVGYYPDFYEYKNHLDKIKINNFNNIGKDQEKFYKKWQNIFLRSQEKFKKLCGFMEISKEEYDKSTSSNDVTDDKLINDFGIQKGSEIWQLYESDNKFCWFNQKI